MTLKIFSHFAKHNFSEASTRNNEGEAKTTTTTTTTTMMTTTATTTTTNGRTFASALLFVFQSPTQFCFSSKLELIPASKSKKMLSSENLFELHEAKFDRE